MRVLTAFSMLVLLSTSPSFAQTSDLPPGGVHVAHIGGIATNRQKDHLNLFVMGIEGHCNRQTNLLGTMRPIALARCMSRMLRNSGDPVLERFAVLPNNPPLLVGQQR